MGLWLVMVVGVASASDELTLAPDRPGVGDSTSTPGRGRVIAQLGLLGSFSEQGAMVSSSAWTMRLGVDKGVEARLRLPDVGLGDGGPSIGTVGVGALIGGNHGGSWSSSVVPEVSYDLASGGFGVTVNGNVAVSLGDLGMWGHASASVAADAATVLAGGGISWSPGPAGGYVNAWHTAGGPTFAGAGGWWLVGPALQLDAGMDVGFSDMGTVWVPGVGVSAGF